MSFSRMAASRENDIYLAGFHLPANVEVTNSLGAALEVASMVLSVMPSHLVRSLYQQMLPYLTESMAFVSATKGLENGTLLRMSEVIGAVLAPRMAPPVAVISGPTFAREVAAGQPTALVVASTDEGLAERVQAAFSGPAFRLYTSSDPIGVEICGSIKNIVAIGAGVLLGLGLGDNPM